ncbi:hypothetical protein NDU88_001231 [Pleurodeles waltl]|uniref:Uncharacterized protein n=1 Tax=Pleurodeles waltl TaxID=8319 RepID=A0AAV7V920_PLEWA|nr:hypothetical protein NDU88_001231 [Pleurodeles waltl]
MGGIVNIAEVGRYTSSDTSQSQGKVLCVALTGPPLAQIRVRLKLEVILRADMPEPCGLWACVGAFAETRSRGRIDRTASRWDRSVRSAGRADAMGGPIARAARKTACSSKRAQASHAAGSRGRTGTSV